MLNLPPVAREITRDEEVYVNVYVSPSAIKEIREILGGGGDIKKGIETYAEGFGKAFASAEAVKSSGKALDENIANSDDPEVQAAIAQGKEDAARLAQEGASADEITDAAYAPLENVLGADAVAESKQSEKQQNSEAARQKEQETSQNLASNYENLRENHVDESVAKGITADLAVGNNITAVIESKGGLDNLTESQKQDMLPEMEKAAMAALISLQTNFGDADPRSIKAFTASLTPLITCPP